MTAQIAIPADVIAEFCERWRVQELSLFGSVLREDFGSHSDVDVLVRFDPGARHTLLGLAQMENELSEKLARKVDLVEWEDVERSPNYIRRESVLQSAETIYAA
ncbi:MAG: nucleotidyltransferase domain-containing protein [Halieaceae bacterium]|nr:nucleotidyltransferase domain-containing protein [Halieaceae bacterium]